MDATSPVIEGADFRDAVITGLPHTIELCRRDKLFMKLLSLPREKRLGELVGDPSGFGFDMVERLWLPAVRRARGRRAGGKRVVDGGGETSFDISDFSAPDAGYSGKTIFFTASWIDSACAVVRTSSCGCRAPVISCSPRPTRRARPRSCSD